MPSVFHSLETMKLVKRAAVAAMATSVLLLAGCSMDSTAPEGNSFVPGATISGKLMGGQQPIAGATIDLYSVGTTGYGSPGVHLATVTTGIGGNYQFNQVTTQTGPSATLNATYGCPSNSTLLYLTATGGDPTNQNLAGNVNTTIKLLDAIGACSTVKSGTYIINEISTVVSLAALQQYINPVNETIGAPSTTPSTSSQSSAQTGITNAFALVNTMLQQSSGMVYPTYSPASSLGTVVATPEVAKINTIADVLASCVNTTSSTSGTCTSLFAAATPTPVALAATTNFPASYSPAPVVTDTLQAGLFMLTNPTDAGTQVTTCNGVAATTNLACLYSLTSSTPPYTGLSSAPTEWTVAVTYASASTQTIGGVVEGVLSAAQRPAIDKNGNVWVTNSSTVAATNVEGLVELSPTGGILQQVLTGTNVLETPKTPTIDPSGNVWIPNYGTTGATSAYGYGKTVVEWKPSTSTYNTYNVGGCPFMLASDGSGNIFVAECTGTTYTNTGGGNGTPGADIEQIFASAASGTTANVLATAAANGYSLSTFGTVGLDANYVLWVGTGGTTVQAFTNPYTANPATFTATDPEPLAIDSTNDVFVANYGTTATTAGVDKLTLSGGTISNASGAPYTGGGLTKAELSAIDGAGNFWTTIYNSSTTAGSITEFSNAGVPLSPATSVSITTTSGSTTPTSTATSVSGFVHTFLGPTGVAVDPSGNVWVGNYTTYSATYGYTATNPGQAPSGPTGGTAAGGFLTVLIGAAVPVVTPIAAGLPATAGGGMGTGAAGTAVLGTGANAGKVMSVTLTSGGYGYIVAPTVAFTSSTGANAMATTTITNGAVTGITVTNPGGSYTTAPTVTINPVAGSGSAMGTPPQ